MAGRARGSLATELRARGRLPFKEALPYIEGMLSALAAAHEIGLVHRDVKPSNVLLAKGQDGALAAKLADFGLASGIEGENSKSIAGDLTRTGTVLGSPGYMAPEVMAGRPATTESDVWSGAPRQGDGHSSNDARSQPRGGGRKPKRPVRLDPRFPA